MHIQSYGHIPPLGWLPLTETAEKDGFLPIYRRLEQSGRATIDEWESLTPALFWRHGFGKGDQKLESFFALELIQSGAQVSKVSPPLQEKYYDVDVWSPERLEAEIPDLWSSAQDLNIALTSPKLPALRTRSAWLDALPQLLPLPAEHSLSKLMSDPALLLRSGYQMLCAEWANHGQSRRQTGEALAVINVAALGLFPRTRCAVCFRLAMPATTRCGYHSQTKNVRFSADNPKLHASVSAQARLAKRVMKMLRWSHEDHVTDLGQDEFSEQKTIAGVLWGRETKYCVRNLQHLRAGLAAGHFPLVRAILPSNFCELDNALACASLRCTIDPSEWVVSYWYARVAAAEAWLKVAENLSPGRTHMEPTEKNRQRVASARALLEQGLSKTDTAVELGISTSHLSHLLRRFPS